MKRVKWLVVAVLVLLIGSFVILFVHVGDGKIDEGTYHIQGFEQYKDAYITVKGDTIRFSNIDLNAIYRETQKTDVEKTNKVRVEEGQKELKTEEQDSDFNYHMVQNAYKMDYRDLDDAKTGQFEYTYWCKINNSPFSLVLIYNSLHKTVRINNENQPLQFE